MAAMALKKQLTAGALSLTLVFGVSACSPDDDQADQTESDLEDQADEFEEDVREKTP
jgi:hypothetical protein